jgi:hypothetical protein
MKIQNTKYFFYIAFIFLFYTKTVFANLKVDEAITAATEPIMTALQAHWGKGVFLAAGVSALIGEGDLRQKAVRAFVGAIISGAVMLALISLFVT